MSSEKRFLNAKEIAEITGLSKEGSYKIIRELNDELTRKGFLTVRGKVINSYFYERFFGNIKPKLIISFLSNIFINLGVNLPIYLIILVSSITLICSIITIES